MLVLAGCASTPSSPKSTAALAVLGSSAGLHEKARACQELGFYGGPEAVPALAALLDKEYLADYARSGLEGIKDASAGEALLKALPTLGGRYLAGAVNSLGVRREVAAVPDLQALALDAKRGVADEAVASLGLIGTREAAKTLQQVLGNGSAELKTAAAHASLVAALQLVQDGRREAARELLAAVLRSSPGTNVKQAAERQVAALK
jgi:HEAT repeat protein